MIICVTGYLCILCTYFYIIFKRNLYAEIVFANHILCPPDEAKYG